ncbi:MAG: CoA-binding protein [Proteobacteria bacterium]|nr:MAG: CoA-binding protein [Pseudomonadota bacterium]
MKSGRLEDDIPGIRALLASCRRIAVVGLSNNWHRPSYFAAKYLKDHGYEIIPVNPKYESVLGVRCYPDLESIPHDVDVVDIFQRAEVVRPFVEQAIAIKARVVWLQLGIINREAAERAMGAGLDVVMNRCMKIEHARLFGGLNLVGVNTGVISSRRPHWLPH